jgi:hypothetical protein
MDIGRWREGELAQPRQASDRAPEQIAVLPIRGQTGRRYSLVPLPGRQDAPASDRTRALTRSAIVLDGKQSPF